MDDFSFEKIVETLRYSNDANELQTALMKFTLKIDAKSCSQEIREQLWKAISSNAKLWKLFIEDSDPTLAQLAAHTLAAFAGDKCLAEWAPIGDILPRLALKLQGFSDEKIEDLESFARDILLLCLPCSQVPKLSLSVAHSLTPFPKFVPRKLLSNGDGELFQLASDIVQYLTRAEKWYRDGTVRSCFTWVVNIGLELFIDDQTAAKFEIGRSCSLLLLNANPPSSLKHRKVVVDTFLPEKMKIPFADSFRTVLMSKSLPVSQRHLSATITLNAGLQRWLCHHSGRLWILSFGSKLFTETTELMKLLPLMAAHCSTEFGRITGQTSDELISDDERTVTACLQLLEEMMEFIVITSENDEDNSDISATALLETHRSLRDSAVCAIKNLEDFECDRFDVAGACSGRQGLRLICFRWGCRFVAQDAVSLEDEVLATFVRYGTCSLSGVIRLTENLIPMYLAALGNILSLDDSEKGKATISKCFVESEVKLTSSHAKASNCGLVILQLVDGLWKEKADRVDSEEGRELLATVRAGLGKLKL